MQKHKELVVEKYFFYISPLHFIENNVEQHISILYQ